MKVSSPFIRTNEPTTGSISLFVRETVSSLHDRQEVHKPITGHSSPFVQLKVISPFVRTKVDAPTIDSSGLVVRSCVHFTTTGQGNFRRHDIPLSTIQKWLGNAQKINAVDATKTMKHNMTKKRMIGDNKQVRKLDQKSQTLFAWIVSAPDPLDMASVRAQARGIWPEWLDKSQSAWKCGDNFRKWCTRFVQRHFPEKFNNRLRLTSADASHTMPCGAGALSNPAAGTNPAERGHFVPSGDGAPSNPANGTPSHAAVDIDNVNQPLLHPSSTNHPDSHRETDNDDEDLTSMTFQDGTSMKLANRDEYGLGYKHIDICCEPIATTGRPPRIAKFSRGGKYQRGVYNESCTRCNAMSPCVSQRLCDNVMTYSECASGRCSAGLNCRNNAIQRRRYPKTTVVECPKLQYALRLEEDVVAGTKIIEYVGERIGKAEFMHRKAHDMGGYLATMSCTI
ncbi:hypothetical protein DYB25_006915 [Aphanomyces astaci]|uniref:AWS domain-containing protein n=1 Tax=Aphanomyces astaci TaxID=112090 RepID=A0A397BEF4_APHAT|nr:hypothetical protein DYB25_006915 [Aphanomyces astaci]